MEEDLETPTTTTTTITSATTMFQDDIDSGCSTPYVSAPSSPGRGQPFSGYYYSAPASPMHYVLSSTASISSQAEKPKPSTSSSSSSFEFDFSARLTTDGSSSSPGGESMCSADELFLNGQIRPMKLSTHLQRPQKLAPLLDCDENDQDLDDDDTCLHRGRDMKLRDKSLRRRTRSMSPLRSSSSFAWQEECDDQTHEFVLKNEAKQNAAAAAADDDEDDDKNEKVGENIASGSETSSRSSSVGRSSKRWVFLKEFLYRSKSEGRNNGHKFWGGLSFSPVKDKKMEKMEKMATPRMKAVNGGVKDEKKRGVVNGKAVNGGVVMGKRRGPTPSAHELHYTANRAQAEELRKKTFLPYRQGLLGCLGFSSKSYGAWNGFTRALNPVSSS